MAKARRFSLREEKRRIAREHPPIEVELDNVDVAPEDWAEGMEDRSPRVIQIPSPTVWSDEVLELSKADPVACAQLLLGLDNYEAWRANGGTAMDVFQIIEAESGITTGESKPSTAG